jgi:hypothetical protein
MICNERLIKNTSIILKNYIPTQILAFKSNMDTTKNVHATLTFTKVFKNAKLANLWSKHTKEHMKDPNNLYVGYDTHSLVLSSTNEEPTKFETDETFYGSEKK